MSRPSLLFSVTQCSSALPHLPNSRFARAPRPHVKLVIDNCRQDCDDHTAGSAMNGPRHAARSKPQDRTKPMEHLANRASPERTRMIETAAYDLHRAAATVAASPAPWYIPQIAVLRQLHLIAAPQGWGRHRAIA
jgi:hypothetical protein